MQDGENVPNYMSKRVNTLLKREVNRKEMKLQIKGVSGS